MLRDFCDFLKAAFPSFEFWAVTLGPFLAGWAAKMSGVPLQASWLWGYLAFCSLMCGFLAWRSQRRAAVELANRPRPELDIRCQQLIIGLAAGAVNVTVIAGVYNNGSPSIAEFFGLRIAIPSEARALEGKPIAYPSDKPIRLFIGDSTDKSITLSEKDWLPGKTAETPIPTGARAQGYLLFSFPAKEEETIRNPSKCVWTLTVTDSVGNKITRTQPQPGKAHEDRGYFAGMERT